MATLDRVIGTFRAPQETWARIFEEGPREDRALAHLMGGCILAFISFLPFLAREAHLTGTDLNMMLGGALFGWMFIAPLLAYTLSLILWLPLRVIRPMAGSDLRRALFWSFFASTPILLLFGLARGLWGIGAASSVLGLIWLLALVWAIGFGVKVGGARGDT